MPWIHPPIRSLVLLLATVLAVPLTALVGAAPAQAATFAGTGTVSDGLGDPLAGVTVTARSAPSYTSTAAEVSTDGDGGYVLPLPAGSYRIQFTKAGYRSAFYGGTPPVDVVVDGTGQLLVDDEEVVDNELDDVTLTGEIDHPLGGTVTDGTVALSGIRVDVFAHGDDESPLDSATTDGSGGYTLEVPSGRYAVGYTDPGDAYLPTWYGGAEPAEITVAADGALLVDDALTGCASLCPVTLSEPAPDQEFPIAGQVVDANGDPVNDVQVAVTPVAPSTDSGSALTATVGEVDGLYSVSVLPGSYQVAFTRAGFVATTYGDQGSTATVTVGATGTLSVAPAEELVGNRLSDLVLASTPFAVTGEVQVAGGSTPIEGITVRAFPQGSTDPAEIVGTAETNATGVYTLTLPIGGYDLEYVDELPAAPTYGSATLADVQVGQGGALTVAGESVAALAPVRLSVSTADTPHPVLGSVVDVTGADIDGLTVSAVPVGSGSGDADQSGDDGSNGAHGRYRLMLKPGDYEIHVDGGSAWQSTTFTGDGESTALVTVALNGTLSVNGTPIGGRDVGETMVPGATRYTLSGTVTDGSAGLPGITVKAYAEDDLTVVVATATSTGANGAWSLTGNQGLVVGSYVVEFSGTSGGDTYDTAYLGGATPSVVEMAQGGAAKLGGAPVAGNTLAPVALALSDADREHPVLGEVLDVNGDPIDGVSVTATPQGSGTAASAATGADGALGDHGRYRLLLQPGAYRVSLTKTGFTSAVYPGTGQTAVDITVQLSGAVLIGSTPAPGGELAEVELLDAVGDATISGLVTRESGGGLGGMTVEVFPAGGELTAETRVAQTTTSTSGTVGSWSVGTLRIGEYTVRFTDNVADATTYIQTYYGGVSVALSTPVKVGQANVISVGGIPVAGGALSGTEMRMAGDTTTYDLIGELLDQADDPIDGATVTAVPQGSGTQATAATGADGELGTNGRYRLALRAGTYEIKFTAAGFTGASYPGPGETPVLVVVAPGGSIQPGSELDSVVLAQTTGAATLKGRVTADGAGVNGITVEVFPEGDLDPGSRIATTTTSTVSTVAGSWSVASLRIGLYTIRFTDNVVAAPHYVQTYYGGADLATATPVKVGQGPRVSVEGGLKVGGDLGATVIAEATGTTTYPLSGDVADANGDPLPGVSVGAVAKGGGAVNATASTNEDGEYTLQVRAGTYEIAFSRTGWTSDYYRNSENGRAQVVVTPSGVTITGDEDPVTDRTLDSFTLRSTTRHPLTGSVSGTGDVALSGIQVRAIPEDTELPAITATSGGDGRFTLQLLVGTYQIEYVGRAIGGTTWDGTFYGGSDTPALVKVATGGAVTVGDDTEPIAGLDEVVLSRSTGRYLIRGTISDELAEPLAGATVRAYRSGTSTQAGTATTDVEGRYALEVPVGSYWLRFEKAGKATAWLLNFETEARAVVTVKAGGAITAPGVEITAGVLEDVQLLLPPPAMVTAPKLTGKIAVGQKIATTLGTWNPDFRRFPGWQDAVLIEWFIDGKPADDDSFGNLYEKYKIPATAGGRKLSYRITIDDPSEEATRAQIVWNSKPVAVPKAKPKLTATYKKGRLTVVVKLAGLNKPLGSFVVLDGKKKVGKATLKPKSKGKVKIKLKKLKRGKHRLTVRYSGDANLAPVKVKLKIKV